MLADPSLLPPQLRDLVSAIMHDQLAHHSLELQQAGDGAQEGAEDGGDSPTASLEGVRLGVLSLSLELVYAAPFASPADQQYVREAIAARFSVAGSPGAEGLEKSAIDANGLGVLRIGTIYLKRGN
jgi:hypothetical protein